MHTHLITGNATNYYAECQISNPLFKVVKKLANNYLSQTLRSQQILEENKEQNVAHTKPA